MATTETTQTKTFENELYNTRRISKHFEDSLDNIESYLGEKDRLFPNAGGLIKLGKSGLVPERVDLVRNVVVVATIPAIYLDKKLCDGKYKVRWTENLLPKIVKSIEMVNNEKTITKLNSDAIFAVGAVKAEKGLEEDFMKSCGNQDILTTTRSGIPSKILTFKVDAFGYHGNLKNALQTCNLKAVKFVADFQKDLRNFLIVEKQKDGEWTMLEEKELVEAIKRLKLNPVLEDVDVWVNAVHLPDERREELKRNAGRVFLDKVLSFYSDASKSPSVSVDVTSPNFV